MREQPEGDQLLEAARSLLRDELLPALPADRRHAGLMIANAMAIAMRQLRNGEDAERREIAALSRVLSTPPGDDTAWLPPAERDRLLLLNRQLCRLIRQGRADAGKVRDSVRDHLLAVARQRVAESNPKYLSTEG